MASLLLRPFFQNDELTTAKRRSSKRRRRRQRKTQIKIGGYFPCDDKLSFFVDDNNHHHPLRRRYFRISYNFWPCNPQKVVMDVVENWDPNEPVDTATTTEENSLTSSSFSTSTKKEQPPSPPSPAPPPPPESTAAAGNVGTDYLVRLSTSNDDIALPVKRPFNDRHQEEPISQRQALEEEQEGNDNSSIDNCIQPSADKSTATTTKIKKRHIMDDSKIIGMIIQFDPTYMLLQADDNPKCCKRTTLQTLQRDVQHYEDSLLGDIRDCSSNDSMEEETFLLGSLLWEERRKRGNGNPISDMSNLTFSEDEIEIFFYHEHDDDDDGDEEANDDEAPPYIWFHPDHLDVEPVRKRKIVFPVPSAAGSASTRTSCDFAASECCHGCSDENAENTSVSENDSIAILSVGTDVSQVVQNFIEFVGI